MNDELLTDDIIRTLINDFTKPDISQELKYKITEEYRRRKNISTRDICKELNIGRTSYYAWKRAAEIGEAQKSILLENGWKESDIQEAIRNHSSSEVVKRMQKKKIDALLQEFDSNISTYIHTHEYSSETAKYIKEVINTLNRILMRVEK